ncbi:MAG: hypothetical protein ACT4PP_15830 [Sporichthyaceae bacterium]
MIAQTALTLSELLASAEAEGGGEGHRNAYLIGVSVFVALTLMLLATLSFNRDR